LALCEDKAFFLNPVRPARKEDLDDTVAIHPTAAEGMFYSLFFFSCG
jgi:hypothetical protein